MPPTPEGPSYICVTGGPYKYGDTVTYEWKGKQQTIRLLAEADDFPVAGP